MADYEFESYELPPLPPSRAETIFVDILIAVSCIGAAVTLTLLIFGVGS